MIPNSMIKAAVDSYRNMEKAVEQIEQIENKKTPSGGILSPAKTQKTNNKQLQQQPIYAAAKAFDTIKKKRLELQNDTSKNV